MNLDLRQRLSAIGHADLPVCNPASLADLDRLGDRIPAGSRALDLACGRADVLARLARRRGITGVGVDRSRPFLDAARSRAAGLPIELVEADVHGWTSDATFDVVLCLGGPWERIDDAWSAARPHLRPGGLLLWGGPFWERAPSPSWRSYLGDPSFHSADDLLAPPRRALDHAVTSQEDWDRYEDGYAAAIERHAAQHPDDPDAAAMLAHVRAWRAAWLAGGRGVLGFALVLLVDG